MPLLYTLRKNFTEECISTLHNAGIIDCKESMSVRSSILVNLAFTFMTSARVLHHQEYVFGILGLLTNFLVPECCGSFPPVDCGCCCVLIPLLSSVLVSLSRKEGVAPEEFSDTFPRNQYKKYLTIDLTTSHILVISPYLLLCLLDPVSSSS